jgi:hypothetical protein
MSASIHIGIIEGLSQTAALRRFVMASGALARAALQIRDLVVSV